MKTSAEAFKGWEFFVPLGDNGTWTDVRKSLRDFMEKAGKTTFVD